MELLAPLLLKKVKDRAAGSVGSCLILYIVRRHRPFWLPCKSAKSDESIKDATFVDDEASLLFTQSPKLLNQAICTCSKVVSYVFTKYNME